MCNMQFLDLCYILLTAPDNVGSGGNVAIAPELLPDSLKKLSVLFSALVISAV